MPPTRYLLRSSTEHGDKAPLKRGRGESGVRSEVDEVSRLLPVMPLFTASPPPPPFLISWSSLHVGAEGQCLLGEGPPKRSGSNSRQQQITQRRRGSVPATDGGALFIHLPLPGKCDGFHEENTDFNVLVKCIQPKLEAFRILLNVT